MPFWDIFTRPEENKNNTSGLQLKIQALLPNATEKELITTACIAGLLARVAYIDFEIHSQEVETMNTVLQKWSPFSTTQINAITHIALTEVKTLAGLENHKYCHPLNDLLTNEEKYQIIESLFAVAASDNAVDHDETEEIRIITSGLRLEHKHFIAARATVLAHLKALKR